MSTLREEIRAILREEIAALRQAVAPTRRIDTEPVRIQSSAELNRFAQELLRRAASPEFVERVTRGELVFELAGDAAGRATIVTGPARVTPATIDKALVTEKDIAGLGQDVRTLRLAARTRLTPLARDEARHRGIRIERIQA